jgi:hypothetical protein
MAANGSYVDGKKGRMGKSKMSTMTIATEVHTLQENKKKQLLFISN